MADKKISQLTAATTPLAGTEVLPIVQSGSTVKVAVSDLTAGRATSMSSATVTGLTASKPVFTDGSKALTSSGTLGTDQGGTGLTAFGANKVIYASSTSALSASGSLNYNGTNLGVGSTDYGSAGTINVAVGVAGTTTGGVQLWSTTAGTHYVQFGDGTTGDQVYRGYVGYAHGTDTLQFGAAGATKASVTSAGAFLVAKATAGIGEIGFEAGASGFVAATSSASTNAADTYNIYSTGASAYRFYVDLSGTIFATNTSVSAISDQRLKENVRDLDAGLAEVMALKPRKFDWKKGKGQDKKDVRGFIAQEFEQVFPDLIDTWKDPAPEGEDPYKSVRADLIPVLVKAIQEQQAVIDELKARITALETA